MSRPPALIGRKRQQAIDLMLAGTPAREVARRFKIAHTTASDMLRAAKKSSRKPQNAPAIAGAPVASSSSPLASPSGAQEPAELDGDRELAINLVGRVEVRNRLLAALRAAEEPRELVLVARQLGAAMDDLDRVIRTERASSSDEDEDVEVDNFDAWFMRVFQKAKVVVAAAGETDASAEVPAVTPKEAVS